MEYQNGISYRNITIVILLTAKKWIYLSCSCLIRVCVYNFHKSDIKYIYPSALVGSVVKDVNRIAALMNFKYMCSGPYIMSPVWAVW
jgi:hypothetical protein